jgi:nifR3 family TIM-barrel protein
MKTFWLDLIKRKSPFFTLAPMEGATDTIFRQIISYTGKPDVFFTEFTNVEGLFSNGAKKVERRLTYSDSEHPIIAQVWGLSPDLFYKATKYIKERGFDGIDINMGCPGIPVTSKGTCAALIKNKPLAKEIISAVKSAAGDLPVSVKTRIGYSSIQTEDWIGFLLEQNIDALTIHGRTRKEMSKVPAHWDEISKTVKLRNAMKKNTVIIGNGDIKSLEEGLRKAKESGVDGIMIGRGIFENAWIFKEGFDRQHITIKDRIDILQLHIKLYEKEHGEKLPYHTLKKYYKVYIRDFDGANEFRSKLMETNTVDQAKDIIKKTKFSLI